MCQTNNRSKSENQRGIFRRFMMKCFMTNLTKAINMVWRGYHKYSWDQKLGLSKLNFFVIFFLLETHSSSLVYSCYNYESNPMGLVKLIILGEGNFWFRFRLFIHFLALWSMDEKVGKLDNRAEVEFKIALAKYYHCLLLVDSHWAVIRIVHNLSTIREYQYYQLCFGCAIQN